MVRVVLSKFTRSLVTGRTESFFLVESQGTYFVQKNGRKYMQDQLQAVTDDEGAFSVLENYGFFVAREGERTDFSQPLEANRASLPRVAFTQNAQNVQVLYSSPDDQRVLDMAREFGALGNTILNKNGIQHYILRFEDGSFGWVRSNFGDKFGVFGEPGEAQIEVEAKQGRISDPDKLSSTLHTNLSDGSHYKFSRDVLTVNSVRHIRFRKFFGWGGAALSYRKWLDGLGQWPEELLARAGLSQVSGTYLRDVYAKYLLRALSHGDDEFGVSGQYLAWARKWGPRMDRLVPYSSTHKPSKGTKSTSLGLKIFQFYAHDSLMPNHQELGEYLRISSATIAKVDSMVESAEISTIFEGDYDFGYPTSVAKKTKARREAPIWLFTPSHPDSHLSSYRGSFSDALTLNGSWNDISVTLSSPVAQKILDQWLQAISYSASVWVASANMPGSKYVPANSGPNTIFKQIKVCGFCENTRPKLNLL